MNAGLQDDLQSLTLDFPQLPLRSGSKGDAAAPGSGAHAHALLGSGAHAPQQHPRQHMYVPPMSPLLPEPPHQQQPRHGNACTYVVPHKSSVVMIADLHHILDRLVRKKLLKRKHMSRVLDAVKKT